jgi:hypothetical protein
MPFPSQAKHRPSRLRPSRLRTPRCRIAARSRESRPAPGGPAARRRHPCVLYPRSVPPSLSPGAALAPPGVAGDGAITPRQGAPAASRARTARARWHPRRAPPTRSQLGCLQGPGPGPPGTGDFGGSLRVTVSRHPPTRLQLEQLEQLEHARAPFVPPAPPPRPGSPCSCPSPGGLGGPARPNLAARGPLCRTVP